MASKMAAKSLNLSTFDAFQSILTRFFNGNWLNSFRDSWNRWTIYYKFVFEKKYKMEANMAVKSINLLNFDAFQAILTGFFSWMFIKALQMLNWKITSLHFMCIKYCYDVTYDVNKRLFNSFYTIFNMFLCFHTQVRKWEIQLTCMIYCPNTHRLSFWCTLHAAMT